MIAADSAAILTIVVDPPKRIQYGEAPHDDWHIPPAVLQRGEPSLTVVDVETPRSIGWPAASRPVGQSSPNSTAFRCGGVQPKRSPHKL